MSKWTTEIAPWEGVDPTGDIFHYGVRDDDGDLRAAFLVGPDAERYVRDRNREAGIAEETGDAHGEVAGAMRSRLDYLDALLRAADDPSEMRETELAALDIGAEHDDHELQNENRVMQAAQEAIDQWPLAVERTVCFEIVLGTGGPDDRIVIECEKVEATSHQGEMVCIRGGYEIRRTFYRYSWTGSAEIELTGDDRDAAEQLARRVVPELAE